MKTKFLGFVGALAILGNALGLNVLLVLIGAGVIAMTARIVASCLKKTASSAVLILSLPAKISAILGGVLGTGTQFGLMPLFAFFLKVGAVLFGSGYVLLAFLRTDLVVRLHWLSDKQLLDAIAVGQVTPGPVFTTATFIGYLLGRIPGGGSCHDRDFSAVFRLYRDG